MVPHIRSVTRITRSALLAWNGILWGGSVTAALFLFAGALGLAKTKALFGWLVVALFTAGYYVWRPDHIRLMPKFRVTRVAPQHTPLANKFTGERMGECVYLQLHFECLTDVDVQQCAGHLRRILRWSEESWDWEETQMNESVRLGWSHDDDPDRTHPFPAITLESHNERRLNLLCIFGNNVIRPIIYPPPLRAEDVLTRDDIFLFDITIRSEHTPPIDLFVRFKRGARWDKPDVNLFFGDISKTRIQSEKQGTMN